MTQIVISILGKQYSSDDLSVLQITEDPKIINSWWEISHIIPFRPYQGQKEMVVGCGNDINLICCGQGLPFYTFAPQYQTTDIISMYPYKNPPYTKHHHKKQYTVNMDPTWNPCVVAFFGVDDLSQMLPYECFDRIIWEAMSVSNSSNCCTISNLLHLLSQNGLFEVINSAGVLGRLIKKDHQTLINDYGFEFHDDTQYHLFLEQNHLADD
jgi:hypothetical protein